MNNANRKKAVLTIAALIGLPFVVWGSFHKGGIAAVIVFLCLYAAAYLGVFKSFEKK
jgi:hypothetical protein